MKKVTIILPLLFTCAQGHTAVHISPMPGYTFGGEVANSADEKFDIKPGESYALSVTTDLPSESELQKGRIGLFYSEQNTHIDEYNSDLTIRNLHFQSAVFYTATSNLSPFLGLSLGTTQLDADWTGSDYRFSSSIFTGLEYQFTENISLQGQLRWIGTYTNSKSYTLCQINGGTNCYIRYEGDWLGQTQASMGIVIRL